MLIIDGKIYGCPVEALSNLLGKKWVAQIIWTIGNDVKRYGELSVILKECSKKMLSQQLHLLIENGIVENNKNIHQNKVESSYKLTDKGMKLLPVLKEMIEWGNLYLPHQE